VNGCSKVVGQRRLLFESANDFSLLSQQSLVDEDSLDSFRDNAAFWASSNMNLFDNQQQPLGILDFLDCPSSPAPTPEPTQSQQYYSDIYEKHSSSKVQDNDDLSSITLQASALHMLSPDAPSFTPSYISYTNSTMDPYPHSLNGHSVATCWSSEEFPSNISPQKRLSGGRGFTVKGKGSTTDTTSSTSSSSSITSHSVETYSSYSAGRAQKMRDPSKSD
jgi:hypothetical protein